MTCFGLTYLNIIFRREVKFNRRIHTSPNPHIHFPTLITPTSFRYPTSNSHQSSSG